MIQTNKLLLVILFLFAGYCTFAEDSGSDINELSNVYYQSGLALIKDSKYEEAIEKFNKALSYRKEFPQALFKLGECYEKLKDTRKAIQNYRDCMKCLQSLPKLVKEEQDCLSQVSRSLDKIDINYKELIKIKNNYISKMVALANECANKKYYRFSCNLLEKILDIAPSEKNARELLDKISKNVPVVAKTTKPDIESARKYFDAGKNYFNNKEYDEAIAEFNKAIESDPKNAETYYWRGNAYKQKGELNKAIADYTEVIKLDPQNFYAYLYRGTMYKQKREHDKAIADYTEAISLNPRNHSAYCNRGCVYDEKGEYDKAIADCTHGIGLDPKCVLTYYNRASAYKNKYDYKSAVADGEMFLKLAPNDPKASQMKTWIEEWKKQIK